MRHIITLSLAAFMTIGGAGVVLSQTGDENLKIVPMPRLRPAEAGPSAADLAAQAELKAKARVTTGPNKGQEPKPRLYKNRREIEQQSWRLYPWFGADAEKRAAFVRE